jgi:uncharacterized Zn-binding protein involved in type VI secretion
MAKHAGRVRDKSVTVNVNSEGGCGHRIGFAVDGSNNVLINNRPALRVTDYGVHGRPYHKHKWHAKGGALRVLINGLTPHRRGDPTEHCAGMGALVEGSPNVLIGDYTKPESCPKLEDVVLRLLNETMQPMPNVPVTVIHPDGQRTDHTTDGDGRIVFRGISSGHYGLIIFGRMVRRVKVKKL